MKINFHHLAALVFVAVIAAGCASAPARFYTLNSTAQSDGATNANYAIVVGPVSIPAEVDRPQFTIQVAPNRVTVDEFNRWAAPLSDNIARVVAGDLAAQLGTPRVAATPVNFGAAYHVSISIQRFESVPGKSVLIDALWVIRKPVGGVAQLGGTVVNESVSDESYDSLAAAHSRALAKVSSDIAAAIRAEADKKP